MDALDYLHYIPDDYKTTPSTQNKPKPATKVLLKPQEGTFALIDLTQVVEVLPELEQAVRTAFHYLHQKRAPKDTIKATHMQWVITLQAAVSKVRTIWSVARKSACETDEEAAGRLNSILYYKSLTKHLFKQAKAITDDLASEEKQKELHHLKEIVEACDRMTRDTTDTLKPETPEARDFIAITKANFENKPSLACPKPLPRPGQLNLPDEYNFRTGQWFATSWGVGYAQIAETIEYLRSIALSLYEQELALKEYLKGERIEAPSLESCKELEGLLDKHLDVLKAMPHSNQVHAGWYYLTALKTQAKTIQASVEAFKKLETSDEQIAIRKIMGCIHSKDAIFAVYEACVLCGKLEHLDRHVAATLARVGASRLVLTDFEEAAVSTLFANEYTEEKALLNYLKKSLIAVLYSEQGQNAELELVLLKLEHNQSALLQEKEVAELFEVYLQKIHINIDCNEIPIFSILSLLHTKRPSTANGEALSFDRFMRLYQAKKECNLLKDIPDSWKKYVEQVIRRAGHIWQKDSDAPKIPQGLFNDLYVYFYGSASKDDASNNILTAIVQQPSMSPLVQAMLYAWALERFVERNKNKVNAVMSFLQNLRISDLQEQREEREKAIVKELFDAYTDNASTKAFLTMRYGDEYMKQALQLRP